MPWTKDILDRMGYILPLPLSGKPENPSISSFTIHICIYLYNKSDFPKPKQFYNEFSRECENNKILTNREPLRPHLLSPISNLFTYRNVVRISTFNQSKPTYISPFPFARARRMNKKNHARESETANWRQTNW